MNIAKKVSKVPIRKKLLFGGFAVVIVLLVVGAVSLLTQKQNTTIPEGRVVLRGELVCLPHKNIGGDQPQTTECAIGFRSSAGDYYGLKDTSQTIGARPFNTPLEIVGMYKSETSTLYQMIGTLSVESIKESPKD